jgi:hypothetical protein
MCSIIETERSVRLALSGMDLTLDEIVAMAKSLESNLFKGSIMMDKKHTAGAAAKWPAWVPFVQLVVNDAITTTTASAPFALMFGRKFCGFEAHCQTVVSDVDGMERHMAKQEWISKYVYPTVGELSGLKKDKCKEYRNRTRKQLAPLQVGQYVMAVDPTRASKWDAVYEGPYTVVGRDDRGAYVLQDLRKVIVGRHFTIEQLKVVRPGEDVDPLSTQPVLVVKRVLKHREVPGGLEYLVEWEDSRYENSWENAFQFIDVGCLSKYWKQLRNAQAGYFRRKR